jgi:hypothetical protein
MASAAAVAAMLAGTAMYAGSSRASSVAHSTDRQLATVNGVALRQSDADRYAQGAAVREHPLASPGAVLLALVNQELVRQYATARGITVDESDVTAAIEAQSSASAVSRDVRARAGVAAFRENIKMFILFDAVRSDVIGHAADEHDDHDEHDENDAQTARDAADARTRAWIAWLAQQRRDADVALSPDAPELPVAR